MYLFSLFIGLDLINRQTLVSKLYLKAKNILMSPHLWRDCIMFLFCLLVKNTKKNLNPNNYSLLFKLVCISLLFPAMKGLHTKIWSLQSIFLVDRSRRSYFVNNLFILKFNCFFLFFISCCFCQRMDTRSLYLIF